MWRLNKHATEQQMGQRKKIKNYRKNILKPNENGKITHNLQNASKAILTGKLIVINAYIQKKNYIK